jgi:hypothetical protein
MTRYVRIAATVCSVLLTLAIIGLWVRSYSRFDAVWGVSRNNRVFQIGSMSGGVVATLGHQNVMYSKKPEWGTGSFPSESYPSEGFLWFRYYGVPSASVVIVPFWFIAVLPVAFALIAFKRPWRFTTRGLLIATTLLAIALGLGVYFL